jgi:adenylate cyclase
MLSDKPLDALVTAQQLNASTLEEHHFLTIHAGIHYGSILLENGNLFGSTINVAARIMNIATRGQILCSSAFVDEIKNQPGITFKPFGKHKLKNVMAEIELFELSSADQSTPFHIDPVCHMLVDPQKGNHAFIFQGKIFHFCGIRCMDLFKSNPEAFTGL